MRKKQFAYSVILVLLLSAVVPGFGYADDDEHEEGEEEYHEYEEDEGGGHEYEEEEEGEYLYKEDSSGKYSPLTEETSSWQKWSRSTADWNKGALFQQPSAQEFSLSTENHSIQIKAFDYKNQVMVELRKAAELAGAGYIGYETTGTGEVWKDGSHLIFKEDSYAVYENMKKTPMPAEVLSENEELYVPINVFANGLGFVIEGNPQTGISLIKE